jgi:hypothetical protein
MSTPEEAFAAWQAAEQAAVVAARNLQECATAGGSAYWTGPAFVAAYEAWQQAGVLYQAYLASIGQLPPGSLPGA